MLAVLAVFLADDAQAQRGSPVEYRVKAAFLLNFAKFVEWPPEAFAAPDAPTVICVIGQDPFGVLLDRTVEGERVDSREVTVRRHSARDGLAGCHILFISLSEREQLSLIFSRLRGSNILTVSEMAGFADAGGMIEFVVEDGKARFYINAATTEAAGLKLSSRLLRVAKQIKSK